MASHTRILEFAAQRAAALEKLSIEETDNSERHQMLADEASKRANTHEREAQVLRRLENRLESVKILSERRSDFDSLSPEAVAALRFGGRFLEVLADHKLRLIHLGGNNPYSSYDTTRLGAAFQEAAIAGGVDAFIEKVNAEVEDLIRSFHGSE